MGKIIKNNVIYGGVPDEVITAWETEEVQDLTEPVMGEADISGIGDGSITGAIAEHEEGITALNSKLTITSGDMQLSSGWTATSKWVKRIGGIVEFYVEATGGSLTVGWNTIGTFPTGFSPTATYDFSGIDNRSGALMQTKVNSSANALQVYAGSAQSGAQVRLHGLFTTAI